MDDRPSQSVYVLVGGVSHTPRFFEKLIAELAEQGIDSLAVPYPTCGSDTEGSTQQDEVRAIQEAVLHFIDNLNRDVTLVLHSYGGWPGSRAVKGLDKGTRLSEGKTTGIVEIVFIAAFLLPDNALMALYSQLPSWLTVENGTRFPNQDSVALLFSDLDQEERKHWFGQFEPHRNAFEGNAVPDAPWHLSIPKTYILCTNDRTASLDFSTHHVERGDR